MKRLLLLLCALLVAPTVFAANPQVELKTTLGNVVIELYPENAPKTVENFLQYVKDGFYDGTIFHRVIPGFMAQGGGFTRNFQQKPTRPAIRNEAVTACATPLHRCHGAHGGPAFATAQFFINVAENDFLDSSRPTTRLRLYRVRPRHLRMEVVQKMLQVPTSTAAHQNVPRQPIVIEQARLLDSAASKPAKAKYHSMGTTMIKLHTNHGVIALELDAAKAPDTVANFIQYVNDGHYTNTIFHRVIDGFMIQAAL